MTEGAAAHYLSYRIKKEESGQEVRSILYGKLKLTTRKIRALKKNSRGLLLNGEPVTVRQTVREGELLQIMMDDKPGYLRKKSYSSGSHGSSYSL